MRVGLPVSSPGKKGAAVKLQKTAEEERGHSLMFDQSPPCQHTCSCMHVPVRETRPSTSVPRRGKRPANIFVFSKSEKSTRGRLNDPVRGKKNKTSREVDKTWITSSCSLENTQKLRIFLELQIHTLMNRVVVRIMNEQWNSGLAIYCAEANARRPRPHVFGQNHKQHHSKT